MRVQAVACAVWASRGDTDGMWVSGSRGWVSWETHFQTQNVLREKRKTAKDKVFISVSREYSYLPRVRPCRSPAPEGVDGNIQIHTNWLVFIYRGYSPCPYSTVFSI